MNEARGKPCQCLEEHLSGHWTGNEQIQTMERETVLDNATRPGTKGQAWGLDPEDVSRAVAGMGAPGRTEQGIGCF